MGWDSQKAATPDSIRAALVETRTWDAGESGEGTVTSLASHEHGTIFWQVIEYTYTKGDPTRHIRCTIIEGNSHKVLTAEMHPYYYSCPLEFLDRVPVESEKWRAGVHEWHEWHAGNGFALVR